MRVIFYDPNLEFAITSIEADIVRITASGMTKEKLRYDVGGGTTCGTVYIYRNYSNRHGGQYEIDVQLANAQDAIRQAVVDLRVAQKLAWAHDTTGAA